MLCSLPTFPYLCTSKISPLMPDNRYLITSALPYANGELHLGHLAGAYLPADIYVRYLRLMGKDVVWVCGSDEHGAAITIRAKKEGISPQEIIDKYHVLNKETFARLGISFDYYHRTSEALHHATAQDFFTRLNEKGDEFEVRSSEQYYDEDFKQFLADRYIKGTCPKCGHTEAYGDQCEKCGSDLSPTELIDPISTLSNKTPVLRATQHWYFKLDKHGEWLRRWIETGELDGQQHHVHGAPGGLRPQRHLRWRRRHRVVAGLRPRVHAAADELRVGQPRSAGRTRLAQIVLVANNSGTVYVDNVYFRR